MSERIYTRCPACHKDTLTINDDRHLLCTWITCPDPTLIDRIGEPTNRRTDALGGPLLSPQPAEPPSEKATMRVARELLDAPTIPPSGALLAWSEMTEQPAEAVSEAAREAAEEVAKWYDANLRDGTFSPAVRDIIQRAITAATAAQQAEIAALREEVVGLEQHKGWVVDALRAELAKFKTMFVATRDESIRVERERDEARECTALWIDREKSARSELATTRERLAKCEASFENLRDRVSDVINRIEHDLTGDLDGDVAFEFDELLELLTKALAAQPLDGGAK